MKRLLFILFGLIALSFCSCSVHHQTQTRGVCRVVIVDTVYIQHGSKITLPKVNY